MKPTNHLRWIKRWQISTSEYHLNGTPCMESAKALQQFWETENGEDLVATWDADMNGEWRDIETAEDTK